MNTKNALEILEDWGDALAINKPAGWLSIPGRGNKENIPVVSQELGAQLRGPEQNRGKTPDLYIVHRLDEGTSGIMIFARTADAHKKLGTLFENQKVIKTYWCLTKGNPQDQIIDEPIFKLPSKKNKSIVDSKGKPSQTKIRVIASHGEFSLVEAKPLTGRGHQIRVHLAHLGAPLVGDVLYGGPKSINNLEVQFPLLHCREIEFEWPEGQVKKVCSAIPPDFNQWLKNLQISILENN